MRGAVLAGVLGLLGGCATFEDPTLILDLRVIGMQAQPPEVMIAIDTSELPTPADILPQLLGTEILIRAVVAEPTRTRGLVWSMTACVLADGGRCDPARPQIPFDSGRLEDPETSAVGDGCLVSQGPDPVPFETSEPGGVVCGRLVPDAALVALLFDLVQHDQVRGLGGIDVGISLRIGGEDEDPALDLYASKQVRFSPRLAMEPVDRRANQNPTISQLLFGGSGIGVELTRRHCAGPFDGTALPDVSPGETVTLYPVEPEDAREVFVVPTLDGQFETLTEVVSYQWLAGRGSFSDATTGGPPDVFGNVKLLGTDWTAPASVTDSIDVPIWVIQRDQRYGSRWIETCIRVRR